MHVLDLCSRTFACCSWLLVAAPCGLKICTLVEPAHGRAAAGPAMPLAAGPTMPAMSLGAAVGPAMALGAAAPTMPL